MAGTSGQGVAVAEKGFLRAVLRGFRGVFPVVWAVEVATTRRGEKPLDWMLLTNAPVSTAKAVLAVIRSYQMRWRIEDFHKTWKFGHCNVEDTQLHSMVSAGEGQGEGVLPETCAAFRPGGDRRTAIRTGISRVLQPLEDPLRSAKTHFSDAL